MCARSLAGPGSLLGCLNHFLTPAVWRQAQAAPGAPRRKARWNLHRLTFVLLALTWCTGDSLPECFETARAWYVASYQSRKRPGTTCPGFLKALSGIPLPVLRALAEGVRRRLFTLFGERLRYRGWHPFGCDGSRKECPRSVELEQRMGEAGKKDSAPTLWLTTIVQLRHGLLWSWRLGKGNASEQRHLIHLLATLPVRSLLVTDAGYIGYELFAAMATAHVRYLIRMSSRATLYTEDRQPLKKGRQGLVWYWPGWAQKAELPPIRARLLRVAGKNADVWLLTDVLDSQELSHAAAAQFYRWRWRNEGLFRTYKRTISGVKFRARTVAQVHREAEGSLLAVQLLLAHAVWELRHQGEPEERRVSARQVLVLIRQDIIIRVGTYLGPRQRQSYAARLERAVRRERARSSPKTARVWPRRKPHKAPKPPKIRRMTRELKAQADKMFQTSWNQD
jgi:DDE family transposase